MRNYQMRRSNPGLLPHNVYMQLQYLLKDYDRLKKERADLLHASPPPPDGMPRAGGAGDPTGKTAVRLACISGQLAAIEDSAAEMKQHLREQVYEEFDPVKAYWSYDYYNYIHCRRDMEDQGPSRRKWNYYKSALSALLAEKLHLI